MALKNTLFFVSLLMAFPAMSGTLDEDIEELIELTKLEEDIDHQYQECISGSAELTESEIRHEMQNEYAEIRLDGEDIALLVSIYSEFYNFSCAYLAGDEIPNFYRLEFKKRFTQAEIRSLIEFYKTPLGLKLNNQWLEISKAYGKTLSDRQAADSFKAQRRYEERMEDFWDYLEKKASEESSEQGA